MEGGPSDESTEVAECLFCGKPVRDYKQSAAYFDAHDVRILLELIGSAKTEADFQSTVIYGHQRWFVHCACAEAHPEEMGKRQRIRWLEYHRSTSKTEAVQASPQPQAGSRSVGGIDIVVGMPKVEVVRLLGEPFSRTSLADFLDAQLSVRSLGEGITNEEYWFFDVLPAPGKVLRVTFVRGKVLYAEEYDWQR
jgi:hypothetical protein